MEITEIKIGKLFGKLDLSIKLTDNRLILVAENGSGKTTVVNLIYYFLSGQWTKLVRYDFLDISVKIDGRVIVLEKNQIDLFSTEKITRLLRKYPSGFRERVIEMMRANFSYDSFGSPEVARQWSERFELPMSLIYDILSTLSREQLTLFDQSSNSRLSLQNGLPECQILYLPTFRRIEQELHDIIPELQTNLERVRKRRSSHQNSANGSYIEMVEFGMEDVEQRIESYMTNLKEGLSSRIKNDLTGGFLKGVINHSYSEISLDDIKDLEKEGLEYILDRIDETVLSADEKLRLVEFVNHLKFNINLEKEDSKLLGYFLLSLKEVYQHTKAAEEQVENFIEICNQYCTNKLFTYDSIDFRIVVYSLNHGAPNFHNEIPLKALSSGEKQIVSLFSHLYLSVKKDFFVIIDEPELSLSVPWQKRFLADISETYGCKGLIAVTHSPFIFEDNHLLDYAHSMREFFV